MHILLILFSIKPFSGEIPQKVKDKFVFEPENVKVEVWIKNLEIPWSLVFLDSKRAIVSERIGRIRLIKEGKLFERPYKIIKDVYHIGEGGLMGLEVHPEHPAKPFIYAMYTYRDKEGIFNRVVRFVDKGDSCVFDKIIIDRIPGAKFHNGGRIKFGPDGMLYITTGENFNAEIAQSLKSPGGKILRVTPDGEIPPDNPFRGSPVWSYGHRNPQGLAFLPGKNLLFSSEHGPSGEFGVFGHDEINIIYKGKNYGWPFVIGAGRKDEYVDPLIVWKQATPPCGMTFYKGSLFVATLRSEALIKIDIDIKDGNLEIISIERWFAKSDYEGKYGRIRDVVSGPDGNIYFLTSNRDGRGIPLPGDDKIYRIKFNQ
jgi:quinoprotein glucose dehydrogenase